MGSSNKTVSTGRAERKAMTRRRLVQVAARRFARRGFVATRTLDVARAAHVSHGTVFVHFPSRDHLVLAVTSEFALQLTNRVHQLGAAGASVREVLGAHLICLAEHEDLYVRLLTEAASLPPRARTSWIGLQSAVAAHLAPVVARETEAGNLRQVDFPLLFNTWIGLLHHYLFNRDLFAPDGSVLARWGGRLLDHFLSLVRQGDHPGPPGPSPTLNPRPRRRP